MRPVDPKVTRGWVVSIRQGDVIDRKRPASASAVESIVVSYKLLGMIKDEVVVRQIKHHDNRLKLVAGLHRVAACKVLGINVPSKIVDCSAERAELMEIDDNLAGADLNALDSAVFLVDRKRLYEKLHLETNAGGDRRSDGFQTDTMSVWSFSAATAEKTDMSDRHVRRLVAVGATLSKDQVRWLRKAPRAVSLADLQCLSRIDDDHARSQVCIALSNGHATSAARAYRARSADEVPATKSPVGGTFKDLRTAWRRASKADRMKFLSVEGKVVAGLLREIRGKSA